MRFCTRDPGTVTQGKGPGDSTRPYGSVVMPPITTLCMDLAVTGLAEGYKVVPCMSSTLGQRCSVVYLLGGNEPALLLTHLAEGMLCCIAVADAFPCASVPTAYSRVSVILLVAFGFLLCVFLAEPAIRQLGTSGVGTRSFGFSWHYIFTSCGIPRPACT